MKKARDFNAKRAPPGQVHNRVEGTCKFLIQRAGGDISKVNIGMVNAAAQKSGIPTVLLVQRLQYLGARQFL